MSEESRLTSFDDRARRFEPVDERALWPDGRPRLNPYPRLRALLLQAEPHPLWVAAFAPYDSS